MLARSEDDAAAERLHLRRHAHDEPVAGTDGGSTDGSWSRDALGNEKIYAGASSACPAITQHVTNNGCP